MLIQTVPYIDVIWLKITKHNATEIHGRLEYFKIGCDMAQSFDGEMITFSRGQRVPCHDVNVPNGFIYM